MNTSEQVSIGIIAAIAIYAIPIAIGFVIDTVGRWLFPPKPPEPIAPTLARIMFHGVIHEEDR